MTAKKKKPRWYPSRTTSVIAIRVSNDHKARFESLLAPKERRAWLEGVIDIEASLSGQAT